MRSKALFFLFFILTLNSFSQVDFDVTDFRKSDSIATRDGIYDSITNVCILSNKLTASLETDIEKTRSIYRWIAKNINYTQGASPLTSRVIKTRKASCVGYSNLFKEMCECIGIECRVVEGWVRNNPNDIGKKVKYPDHAWNIAKIEGKDYFFDAGFSSSIFDLRTNDQKSKFQDVYFAIDPGLFIYSHYPQKKEDQLLRKKINHKTFFNNPIVFTEFFVLKGIAFNPQKGSIKCAANNPIKFEFFFKKQIEIAQIKAFIQNEQEVPIRCTAEENGKLVIVVNSGDLPRGTNILSFYDKDYAFISYRIFR